jgi:formylglycine-generating enzyme required for sulfatase activity
MSKRDGVSYRLPTEAEWTYAVGTGTYPWGYTWPPPLNAGNYMGMEQISSSASASFFRGLGWKEGQVVVINGFRDNHVFTAPVASYSPNGLGIYDLGGNVWEWCEDWINSSKTSRVLRGGSWRDGDSEGLASSCRGVDKYADLKDFNYGFRCVVVR